MNRHGRSACIHRSSFLLHRFFDSLLDQRESGFIARLCRLVSADIGGGQHRVTVLKPDDFAGHWLEFSRDTATSALMLKKPDGLPG